MVNHPNRGLKVMNCEARRTRIDFKFCQAVKAARHAEEHANRLILAGACWASVQEWLDKAAAARSDTVAWAARR